MTRTFKIALVTLMPILAGMAWEGTAMAQAANTRAAQRWRSRVLLVFAPPGDHRLLQQRRIVGDATGAVAERDLHIVEVVGPSVDGLADGAATLRERYHVPDGAFATILIGKDGGEKLRTADPIAAERLFDTIDAMPMRRSETRR